MKIHAKLLLLLLLTTITQNTLAEDKIKWSEIRLFHSTVNLTSAPTALNNLTASDNVPALDTLRSLGLEIDGQWKWLKIGAKFTYMNSSSEPPNSPFPPLAYQSTRQFNAGVVGRLPIVNKDSLLFDVFAEIGASDTTFDVQTTGSGRGTLDKDQNFYQRAGASVGAGTKDLKLYVEVGQEFNKLDGLKSSGSVVSGVSSVDLSGPYYSIGLIISGVPDWLTPTISSGK